MGLLVKICGITSIEAADAAARAGADIAGLNFHTRSPRYLKPEQASALAGRMRGKLQIAAVLSDPSDEVLAAAVSAAKPDYLQLHGAESPDRVAAIRDRYGVAIIKAIAVAEAGDFDQVAKYEGSADMFLFDAKAPAAADREGGHGMAFDWQMLRGRTFPRPWLLAGGLNPQNVARAIRSSQAPGVDVSSGVEISPGHKSADLIVQFVAIARRPLLEREARS
jgi:phosphoribosylanthranilate isomerase